MPDKQSVWLYADYKYSVFSILYSNLVNHILIKQLIQFYWLPRLASVSQANQKYWSLYFSFYLACLNWGKRLHVPPKYAVPTNLCLTKFDDQPIQEYAVLKRKLESQETNADRNVYEDIFDECSLNKAQGNNSSLCKTAEAEICFRNSAVDYNLCIESAPPKNLWWAAET